MTSLVNTETGEIVELMSADEARRLTERLRVAATNYTDAKAKVLALVDEAKAGGAHLALGYKSWTAYLSDVLSDEPLRLARDERRELNVRLADEGMTPRAIAKVTGDSHPTVWRDIKAADAAAVSDETTDPSKPAPVIRTATGLDGRQRTTATAGRLRSVPRPAAERTLALIQSLAAKAARESQTLTPDQIRRVRADAGHIETSIRQSIEALQRLADALTNQEDK